MKTRKEVLKAISNAQDFNPYKIAENYLLSVIPLWMPDQLANCTNRLVKEASGQINEYECLPDSLFL